MRRARTAVALGIRRPDHARSYWRIRTGYSSTSEEEHDYQNIIKEVFDKVVDKIFSIKFLLSFVVIMWSFILSFWGNYYLIGDKLGREVEGLIVVSEPKLNQMRQLKMVVVDSNSRYPNKKVKPKKKKTRQKNKVKTEKKKFRQKNKEVKKVVKPKQSRPEVKPRKPVPKPPKAPKTVKRVVVFGGGKRSSSGGVFSTGRAGIKASSGKKSVVVFGGRNTNNKRTINKRTLLRRFPGLEFLVDRLITYSRKLPIGVWYYDGHRLSSRKIRGWLIKVNNLSDRAIPVFSNNLMQMDEREIRTLVNGMIGAIKRSVR